MVQVLNFQHVLPFILICWHWGSSFEAIGGTSKKAHLNTIRNEKKKAKFAVAKFQKKM